MMVASFSLFLLHLSASSYHCRHGATDDGRRHLTPLFGVKPSSSSSRSSGLRRVEQKKSFLSAKSTGIEGQIDDGRNIVKLDVYQLRWEEKYLLLKRFQEREGHCDAPPNHKEDGAPLGRWVSNQRQSKKKGKLNPERQKILEEIGFEWATAATWKDRFALLKQFKKREGHCNVPQMHEEDGANLGTWVNTQRQYKKKEKLDPEREKLLEEIGFEWVALATWHESFALLKQFKKREGHCNVPVRHTEDGANLGIWVNTQRQFKKKGILDPERQKLLGEMGIEWGLTSATWEESFALLKQFNKREGHCNVPQSHKEDGANLGAWAISQRQLKRKEKLDPERQKLLEEIGIEWGLTSATWEETFARLKQFKRREGHCNIPMRHTEDGANLGAWAIHQRQLKRKKKLDPERQKILEEIGFEWVALATWDEIYALLKQFKKREGHCNVPVRHTEDGANLGTWANTQRQFKKKGILDPDRQKLLGKIGIEWGLTSATWKESFALLKQFNKREGHCNIPQSHKEDGANLGTWATHQRQLKKKEKLDPKRKKLLEKIGFEWATSATWKDRFALLKQFKKREGHCNVPQLHEEDGVNLGTWVNTQRQYKKKEKLDPEREKLLGEIGIEWGLTSATWEESFALFQQFKKREDHWNVPQWHEEDGSNLGAWVSHQRQLKRNQKINPDRQKTLEEIGFEWVTSATWGEIYSRLKQFKGREGHCNVPMRHTEDGANLGTWVNTQRQYKRIGKLDPDREKSLEEIGFEWAVRSKV